MLNSLQGVFECEQVKHIARCVRQLQHSGAQLTHHLHNFHCYFAFLLFVFGELLWCVSVTLIHVRLIFISLLLLSRPHADK